MSDIMSAVLGNVKSRALDTLWMVVRPLRFEF
jgi:hypothetical protein